MHKISGKVPLWGIMTTNLLVLLEKWKQRISKYLKNPSVCRWCDSVHECELCSYWWGQKHCETTTGSRKLLFGGGIQFTVESSEYYFSFKVFQLHLDVKQHRHKTLHAKIQRVHFWYLIPFLHVLNVKPQFSLCNDKKVSFTDFNVVFASETPQCIYCMTSPVYPWTSGSAVDLIINYHLEIYLMAPEMEVWHLFY